VQEATTRTGVVIHEEGKAEDGYNFFTSGHASVALLMDMNGRIVHEWRHTFGESFAPPEDVPPRLARFLRRAYLYPNGDILGIYEGVGLIKVDHDSNILWARNNRAHHDLEVLPDGRILVLTRAAGLLPHIDAERPILEDFISILSPEGEEVRRISVLAALEGTPWQVHFDNALVRHGDIFHTNTLRVIGEEISLGGAFAAGNVITSLHRIHLIGVIDLESEAFVWGLTGRFRMQHDPRLLGNGNLLLFDNLGFYPWSRVLELDPATGESVWEFKGSPERPFFTKHCGVAYRLGNGNTLMVESGAGRAIEVTSEQEIVWEFSSPYRAGPRDQNVASLFDLRRIPRGHVTEWLKEE